jgi:hypothetical protein
MYFEPRRAEAAQKEPSLLHVKTHNEDRERNSENVERKKVENPIGRVLGRSNNNANANAGVAYANTNNASSNSNTNNGGRLC